MFCLSLYSCLKCCNLVPKSPTFETAMVVSLQQIKLLASWEDPLIWLWAGAMHHFCLANSRKRSNGFGPQRSWQNWPNIKKSSPQQNRAKMRRATHSLTIPGQFNCLASSAFSGICIFLRAPPYQRCLSMNLSNTFDTIARTLTGL